MNEISDDVETLADDAGVLMDDAASAVRKQYGQARKKVSDVLEHGRDIYGIACKRAVKETKAADGVIHDNLYLTLAVGAGVGMMLGYLLARRSN